MLIKLIEESTGAKPRMWGTAIVGFGTHHYKYDSGRTGDTAAIGFAVRKQALAVYGLRTIKNEALLKQFDSQQSKGCIYIKNVEQIDQTLLQEAIVNAYLERNS